MGIFDSGWMTPERAAAFQGIGLGLSQLDAGQTVNLSPVYDAMEKRKQAEQMRKVMDVPGLMDRFTPEQRAVLAAMPEQMATQIIMENAFATPEPVKGVAVGGNLVNPITGEVMYAGGNEPVKLQTVTGADGAVYTFDPVSGEMKPALPGEEAEGLDPDRYRVVGATLYDLSTDPPTPVGQGAMQEEVIMGADGKPIVIRGGAGTMKAYTEAQSKDNVFATRAKGALQILDPVADQLTSVGNRALEYDPTGVLRAGQSSEFQVAKQAGDEFLQAILRKDTGAAITPDEQNLYGKTYLPQPGDGPAVLEAKKASRARAIAALESGMSERQVVDTERALVEAARRVDEAAETPKSANPEAISDDDLLKLYGGE
ncbi:MAG: hypothetical protein ACRCSU_07885 [Paracoccaceae bacterium]